MKIILKMAAILFTMVLIINSIPFSAVAAVLSNSTDATDVLLQDFTIGGQTMSVGAGKEFTVRSDNLYASNLTLSTDLSVSSDGSLIFSFSFTNENENIVRENTIGQIVTDVITTEGFLYNSLISGSTPFLIALFEDTNNHRVLNFQLERSASPASIINKELANLPVIKVVIFNDQTGDLYYFEEALPADFNFKALNGVTREAVDKDVIDNLTASYLWFWNFAERIEEPLNHLTHHGDIRNNSFIALTVPASPIPGMSPNDFMNVGFSFLPPQRLSPNSSWGFLRESVRTPWGGISTFAIRYVYDHGIPIANPGEARGGFRLTHNMEVTWHPDANPPQFVVWGTSLWRLENVGVSLGLGTANAEIIVETQRSARGGGTLSINTASMIGGLAIVPTLALSKGSFLVAASNMVAAGSALFNSVQWRATTIDGNGRSVYPSSASGQFTTYGRVIRADSILIGNNGYLRSDATGSNVHYITLVSQLRRTGVTNYVTGNKTASWGFYFSVIERDGLGFWTRNRWNHDDEGIIDSPYSGNFPG